MSSGSSDSGDETDVRVDGGLDLSSMVGAMCMFVTREAGVEVESRKGVCGLQRIRS